LFRPPVAAVYVNVIVLPVEPASTDDVGVVKVPDPSAASVVAEGVMAVVCQFVPMIALIE
jgi:hypothetical protein